MSLWLPRLESGIIDLRVVASGFYCTTDKFFRLPPCRTEEEALGWRRRRREGRINNVWTEEIDTFGSYRAGHFNFGPITARVFRIKARWRGAHTSQSINSKSILAVYNEKHSARPSPFGESRKNFFSHASSVRWHHIRIQCASRRWNLTCCRRGAGKKWGEKRLSPTCFSDPDDKVQRCSMSSVLLCFSHFRGTKKFWINCSFARAKEQKFSSPAK